MTKTERDIVGRLSSSGPSRSETDPAPPKHKSGTILFGLSAILVAVAGLGVWGGTAPLASAIVANGKFVVDSRRKKIQHAEGGTIRAIHANDGDRVKAGDILLELEGGRVRTNFAVTRVAYMGALLSAARLRAIVAKQDVITVPKFVEGAEKDDEIAQLLSSQKILLTALLEEQAGQVKVLRQRIAQLKDEVAGLNAEKTAVLRQKDMATEELQTLIALQKKGYATRDRVLAARREKTQLEGRHGRLSNRIASARKEMGTTELEIIQLRVKLQRETIAELRETEQKIFDLKERFLEADLRMKNLEIRAPVSGTVVDSQISTIGGVIRSSEILLEIVPDRDRLLVEARVKPEDVDNVFVSLPTTVRLSGMNQRRIMPLDGRVVYVSADSLEDPNSGASYFMVKAAIPSAELGKVSDLRLVPGMPAEIMIKTGKRTAIAYLMQPFFDSMNRAWREQ